MNLSKAENFSSREEFLKSLKNGQAISIAKTKSKIQAISIEGTVYFDSWDEKFSTLYVSLPNESKGKRFLIDAEHIL